MAIELHNAAFGYDRRPVVRVDHLDLHPGRCVGISGPNGSGKTTLVRGIAGLLPPILGSVWTPPGTRFGYVTQLRQMNTDWPMTSLDVAALPLSATRPWGWLLSERRKVRDALRSLDLADVATRPFATLSGGQRQRVLLAGALAADPTVLILDEPTDGLDRTSRTLLLGHLHAAMGRGLCLVVISHSPAELSLLKSTLVNVEPADDPALPSVAVVSEVAAP